MIGLLMRGRQSVLGLTTGFRDARSPGHGSVARIRRVQHFFHERGIDMRFLKRFYQDEGGDMAEKAVVMAAIIIGAYATWRLLGSRISSLVSQVTGAI